jgi:hypothetical protein
MKQFNDLIPAPPLDIKASDEPQLALEQHKGVLPCLAKGDLVVVGKLINPL